MAKKSAHFLSKLTNSPLFYPAYTLPVVLGAWLLVARDNQVLKTISVLARYNTTRTLPVLAIFLGLAFTVKNRRISNWLAAMIIIPLFALALNGLWAGAYSEGNVIAGLIPKSDAFSFYTSALNFLERGFLNSYTMRRPFFGAFLAFLLWVTNGHFQAALAIIAMAMALVTLLAVLSVRQSFGGVAATVFLMINFLFARRFLGITMSEVAGYLFGMMSFATFLHCLRQPDLSDRSSLGLFALASFFYALAQAARPGAFITLPLLVFLALWLWRSKRRGSLISAGLILLVILAAFGLSSLYFKTLTQGGTVQSNNLGYGFYGVVAGGKGWDQILVDHPQLAELEGSARTQEMMRVILNELVTHPENFIKGMGVQLSWIFSADPTNSVYSFTSTNNRTTSAGLIYLLFALMATGTVIAIRRWKEPRYVLLLALTLGFLFSLPVAPAYQTQYMRVYAATIPLLAILPAVGAAFLTEKAAGLLKLKPGIQEPYVLDNPNPLLIVFVIITLLVLIGPLVMHALAVRPVVAARVCAAGQEEAVVDLMPASSVNIFANTPDRMTWSPNVSQLDYARDIHGICCGQEIAYFGEIPAGKTITPTLNLLNGKALYLISDTGSLPVERKLLRVCGRIEDVNGKPAQEGFLYPVLVEPY